MVNYWCTSPKPIVKGTDAVYNEVLFLKNHIGGELNSLIPYNQPSSSYPILLYGFHKFITAKYLDNKNKIHHIFGSGFFHLPMFYFLKKPIIYTITGGLNENLILPRKEFLNRLSRIVVSNERDFERLKGKGLDNVTLIKTVVAQPKNFESKSMPLKKGEKVRILMASAPWEKKQFESKGVHLLLKYLKENNDVFITFLWRDILADHMIELIEEYGVKDKVEFINEYVDIYKLLESHHATILLTNDCQVIKPYPHSLIKSLYAKRPVIVSSQVAMSDFVNNHNLGMSLDDFENKSFKKLIQKFKIAYSEMSRNLDENNIISFSEKKFISNYKELYYSLLPIDAKVYFQQT